MQFGTKKVMEFLRGRSKGISPKNIKINEWIDRYLETCLLNGAPINILTQWCITKDIEQRFKIQGNKFIPTKDERKLFESEMPKIIAVFQENGFKLNWWTTFNRSYLDMGRIENKDIENSYKKMIVDLAGKFNLSGTVSFFDWEDEILGSRPEANKEIMENMDQYVASAALDILFEQHSKWANEDAKLGQTKEEIIRDVKFKISCEVEEGKLLVSDQSPIGKDFIIAPLEAAERYDFFSIFAPNLKNRIIPVLSSYPWRMK